MMVLFRRFYVIGSVINGNVVDYHTEDLVKGSHFTEDVETATKYVAESEAEERAKELNKDYPFELGVVLCPGKVILQRSVRNRGTCDYIRFEHCPVAQMNRAGHF